MKPSTETHMAFYRHLGRLFYAVAAADGKVHPAEQAKLKSAITESWLKVDEYTDEYGTDSAHYIGIVFDWLIETSATPAECLGAFKRFCKKHPELFTREVNALIWKTANAVAAAYASKNKSELVVLGQIRECLMA